VVPGTSQGGCVARDVDTSIGLVTADKDLPSFDTPPAFYAHSRNERGERQVLADHVAAVANLAGAFAGRFGASSFGRAAGQWHDLGKYHPAWQEYLLAAEAGAQHTRTGPDHKSWGAIHARNLAPLAFAIAGHHGGLMDQSKLRVKLKEWSSGGNADFPLPAEAQVWADLELPELPSTASTRLGLDLFTP